MQVFELNTVALTLKDISWFIFLYKGENFIGNKGCEFLSKAQWPYLKLLQIGSNNIQSEGVNHLSRSHWP